MRRRCEANVSFDFWLDGLYTTYGRFAWRLNARCMRAFLRANRSARIYIMTTLSLSSPFYFFTRFREVMYLRALSFDGVGHPNIIKLRDVIRANNDRDLYMTFEYSETDLSRVIKARVLEPAVRIYAV